MTTGVFSARRRVLIGVGAILLATLSGCGYGLVGRGGGFDPTIKRIGVPLFRDLTGKAGLDQKLTEKVIEELLKRGKIDVVQTIENVDAIVDGEIVAVSQQPVGISDKGGATTASRYQITVTAKVKYYKPGVVEPIWQNDSFIYRDEYDLGSNPGTSFFDREDQGVERLAIAFARSLVAAMLEAF